VGRVISWASFDGVAVEAQLYCVPIPDFTERLQFRQLKFVGCPEVFVLSLELRFRRVDLLNPSDCRHFARSRSVQARAGDPKQANR